MNTRAHNTFDCRQTLSVDGESFDIYSLETFAKKQGCDVSRLPFSIKVLLENLLRNEDGRRVRPEQIQALSRPRRERQGDEEISFSPARVLMQDFTGVPAIVDLAAMRDAMKRLGGKAERISPLVPVDLVIDHSVQVDRFGSADAFQYNSDLEFQRNHERYAFLRWGQNAFQNFRVVPPETGIVHQVNLEYLAQGVLTREGNGQRQAFPDTLVGTDSHTTMINGLGVVGWGVGGIEAEAAMLGQPLSMLIPEVIGLRLSGQLPAGATATDAVLTVTEILRKKGVVGKFVEFYGPGLRFLSLPDRATLANMAPEYGATIGFFPIDEQTLRYLELSGRPPKLIRLVEAYSKAQGLFRSDSQPEQEFSDTLSLDLGTVEPSLAGPKRPQDRVALKDIKSSWERSFPSSTSSVVIAAITSCTNTSNPSVMLGAGILAKKAVERGLSTQPWVKTSLAPGSKVVIDYLKAARLMPYLEQLGFHLVGYGCTTCIGNSGPLQESVLEAIRQRDLTAVAVLSGNRNFEGRIHALVKANYLASPPLVVAYAIAGRIHFDPYQEPLGTDAKGKPVYLKELWPTSEEIQQALVQVNREMYTRAYSGVFEGDNHWKSLPTLKGQLYTWEPASTYVKNPPFFEDMKREPGALKDLLNARVLAVLGDSVTTDHISPAGSIPKNSPAGQYLL
ncbi:MAG: aconitate hydratase, partial [Elusimicrobiota bacterium]